jgi:vacuolar-type H+-ATPase subunit F/Vma7
MQYIKVRPDSTRTSYERALEISKELFNISRPVTIKGEHDATQYMFGWIEHPNPIDNVTTALCIDDINQIIPVHPDKDLTALIALFEDLTEQERDSLASYISSQQSFPFVNIIPSNTQVYTEEEMDADGWFPTIGGII